MKNRDLSTAFLLKLKKFKKEDAYPANDYIKIQLCPSSILGLIILSAIVNKKFKHV